MDLRQYLIFGTSALVIFSLQGCEKESDHQVRLGFYVKNSSEYPVAVELYNRKSDNKLVDIVQVSPQDSALFLSYDAEGSKNLTTKDFDLFFQKNQVADSAYIEFGSEKYLTYSLDSKNLRSLFEMKNYRSYEVAQNAFIFSYDITDADYASAKELDK
jgi:hypothetical protein